MKQLLFALSVLFSSGIFSQAKFGFEATNQYHLIENGDSLSIGWGGGLNQPQFSSIDLNNDGNLDLLAFDRSGDRIIPFLQVQKNGSPTYRYAPKYIANFPKIEAWMLLVDYNCDGKKDIFCYAPGGIGVYKNISNGDTLKFIWALNWVHLQSDYGSGKVNLYNYDSDIPAIVDVDNDGDIDILSFGQNNSLQWHENDVPCGLNFTLNTWCWGRFEEGQLNNKLLLNACTGVKKTDYTPPSSVSNKTYHTGSSSLILDLDGNGLKDVLIGDVSSTNGVAALNTGIIDSAFMSSQDTLFPSYNTPIDLHIFPAFYYEDVDFDGKKDLLAAPNIQGSKSVNNVWYYKNTNTTASPIFNFQDSAFLQRNMLDLGEGAIPVLVDINFDGLTDLFVSNYGKLLDDGNYTSFISYYQNTGTINNPKFTLQVRDLNNISQLNLGLNLIPTFGDLDGDVDLDMLVGADDGKLYYFENTGGLTTPSFTFSTANYQGIDVGNAAAPQLFDIDNDGHLDLIIGEETGNLNYYKHNGTTPASFTLLSENLGGVDTRTYAYNSGFSVPNFYRRNDTTSLFVGSTGGGVFQFDSIENVLNLPPVLTNTLGSGTVSTTNGDLTPFGTAKRNGRNQLLYRASELIAAGFEYGKITTLSFNITNSPTNIVSQGFSIKMKNVKMQSLTNWENGLTEVYNYLYPASNGWNDITLSTPFLWDGVSDLVIEICFSKNFQSQNIPVECTDVGFASNVYGDVSIWNGNTQDGCAMPFLAASTIRPNIRLKIVPTFIANGSILQDGNRNAPAVADLNGDQFPDMILGNYCGGVTFYKGVEYVAPGIGIKENRVDKVKSLVLYPVPSQGLLTVEIPEGLENKNCDLRIFDLTGRVMLQSKISGSNAELNLTEFSNGIYFVILSDTKNTYQQRFIIQK